ncbi:MAG: PHP domain-containing protein, partial [Candidatus Micrarchaeia archaeon]
RGLDGVAVTDHNKTDAWIKMLNEGVRAGIVVILGEEIEVEQNGKVIGEVLGYFLAEEVKRGELGNVLDEIASQGGIAALPHPFCFWRGMKADLGGIAKKVDAVEVFNSRMYFNSQNRNALELARKHKLAEIGGSDAHTCWEVGNAYTHAEADGVEEFRKAIMKRKTKAEGKLTNPLIRFLSHLSKIGVKR